ncbi:MAG TPA: amino acid permease [Candidatus Limnocylindrales bacterium]
MSPDSKGSSEQKLNQFGYSQEFSRTFARFASFAIGFSFISITTGIFTTYGFVLNNSGPVGIWTWPLVIVGQLAVALVFGALAARMPLAGYSYQWMSRLANPHIGWLLGWVAFMFLIVDVVAVDYAVAATVIPSLFGYVGDANNTWVVTAIVIALQALLIMFSTLWSERINNAAVATELIGIGGLTVLLLVVGAVTGVLHWDHLTSTGVVSSTDWFSLGSLTKESPLGFAFLLGAFTIVGFEACGNLAEETSDAEKTVPRAMWMSVVLSGIVGFLFLIAITAASGDIAALTASGTPVADIVTSVLGDVVGKLFLIVVAFSIFACGLVIFITASRLTWAMSRDERFPGWKLLRVSNAHFKTPLYATIVVGLLIEVVLALFAKQANALSSLFSAATLLPAIIYASTVVLYIVERHKLPKEQGFHLGKAEPLVILVAVVWLAYELSIFRDGSFTSPWQYAAIMFLIGVAYYIWMRVTRRSLVMPGTQIAPGDEFAQAPVTGRS